MRRRAESVEQTRAGILEAALALVVEHPVAAITLPMVAHRADVTVQTVLRHFGTRDGLIDAAIELETAREMSWRDAPSGDIDDAVRALVDRYEETGDRMLTLLGQEQWDERVRTVTDHGRAVHRAWVSDAFAEHLGRAVHTDRTELVDLLVVATDLYTWKLLRRDRGLSRDHTLRRMRRLVLDVLTKGSS